MTPKELLRPRRKVIALWPDCPLELSVGDVLTEVGAFYHTEYGVEVTPNPDDYPHLFRFMEWWEDRRPEDMPDYVIGVGIRTTTHPNINGVFKVTGWEFGVDGNELIMKYDDQESGIMGTILNWITLEPATEEEFIKFKKS